MKILTAICMVFWASVMYGQTATATPAPATGSGNFDINIILAILAVFLLFPLSALGNAFVASAKQRLKSKGLPPSLQILIPFFFILLSGVAHAQTATTAKTTNSFSASNTLTITLLCVIGIEIMVMIFFAMRISGLTKEEKEYTREIQPALGIWDRIQHLWAKSNFKPIEKEAEMDLGHNYDGIRELDNVIPPWFTTAFLLTILFAGVYLYRYHVAKSAPLQLEELKIAMTKAELEHETYLSKQANSIDENSVAAMTAADIDAGKQIFTNTCAVCHRADGGGQVGPNLTDPYWIHGGGLKNIFKTIKYGVPDKGMISWKEQLSPTQIAQVSNYILTLSGTNPPAPKEKQGDLYVPDTTAASVDTAVQVPDSLVVK